MNTHDLYETEIESELLKLVDIEDSDEHRKAVGDVSQLTDRYIRLKEIDIEREKLELDREKMDTDKEKTSIEQQKLDLEREKASIEQRKLEFEREKTVDEQRDRRIKNGIAMANIIVPAGITLTGMFLMFLFEEKGTITSGAGRKIVDRIFRMK